MSSLFQCTKTINFDTDGYSEYSAWEDNHTFLAITYGSWDRDRYYIEGIDFRLIERGQVGQQPFDLIKFSSTAAQVKALKMFKDSAIKMMQIHNRSVRLGELLLRYEAGFKNARILIRPQRRVIDVNLNTVISFEIRSQYLIQKIQAMAEGKISQAALDKVAEDAKINDIQFDSSVNTPVDLPISQSEETIDDLTPQVISTNGGFDKSEEDVKGAADEEDKNFGVTEKEVDGDDENFGDTEEKDLEDEDLEEEE